MENNWNWTEATEEEFETNRKTQNYYRIYHKENDKSVNDYKFWAKSDDEALEMLNKFKTDHNDNIEYFYSTSGYHISDGKRFDTLDDVMEDYRNSNYAEEDRKLDIERINELKNEIIQRETIPTFNSCLIKIDDIRSKKDDYINRKTKIIDKLGSIDIDNLLEKEYDDIIMELRKINDLWYEIRDFEYLTVNKHNYSESWNLYCHILDDLEYNLPRLLKEKCGYPTKFCVKASEKLGTMYENKYEFSDEECNLASKMWNEELEKLLLNVKLYRYYEEFGIIDETNPEEVEFHKRWSHTIPHKEGTNKELDYTKLRDLQQIHWNFIWDWMKENGQNLWD